MIDININNIDFNNFKYIYLDVDGVLIKSVDIVCEILNKRTGKNLVAQNITTWLFQEYGELSDDEVEDIFDMDEFFDSVKFYDGAIDFIKKNKDKIRCVTRGRDLNISKKKILFASNGINVPIIGIPLNCSKDIINMENCVFIDDVKNNLTESNASVKIMFKDTDNDTEWQHGWNGLRMKGWV